MCVGGGGGERTQGHANTPGCCHVFFGRPDIPHAFPAPSSRTTQWLSPKPSQLQPATPSPPLDIHHRGRRRRVPCSVQLNVHYSAHGNLLRTFHHRLGPLSKFFFVVFLSPYTRRLEALVKHKLRGIAYYTVSKDLTRITASLS